jgi:hypothetical protein
MRIAQSAKRMAFNPSLKFRNPESEIRNRYSFFSEKRHNLKLVHIDQTFICELQFWDDR